MGVLSAIYQLFIGPLELFFEVVFAIANRIVDNPGVSIVILSLAMNFLVLPLYRRADVMQEEERDRAARMKPWVDHIKRTFKGDERFMMLQTYYRQCNYKQTDGLKGSVSLLLEIPFFIAAYHFLSNLQLLRGVSFGPIADLGAPDALLAVGDVTINVLPLLMTVINVVSGAIYMKGFPLKSKVQMYGITAIFLVLLYASPAGLVFYWTLNNVFSLFKNVFYKLPNPKLALHVLLAVVGVAGFIAVIACQPASTAHQQVLLAVGFLLLASPLAMRLVHWLRTREPESHTPPKQAAQPKYDTRAFILGCVFLALLTGLLIPSAVIQDSPLEFVDMSDMNSPLWYVFSSLLTSVGLFVIWFGVFYWLASPKGKSVMGAAVWAFCGIAAVDYLFFGTGYGNLSSLLRFDTTPVIPEFDMAMNLVVACAIGALFAFVWVKKSEVARVVCLAGALAVLGMSAVNMMDINTAFAEVQGPMVAEEQAADDELAADAADEQSEQFESWPDSSDLCIPLSRDGKNVVVIMLDRAATMYLPYALNAKPGLLKQFSGFTYYPNTLSYGANTNVGASVLYGGYEYTPERMNERAGESLGSKHNEALKVMPVLFDQNDFKVTVFDPTYAGYSWVPDLSIFNDYPGIRKFITMDGSFVGRTWKDAKPQGGEVEEKAGEAEGQEGGQEAQEVQEAQEAQEAQDEPPISSFDQLRKRDFFCYSIFKVSPLVLQPTLYDEGNYNSANDFSVQTGAEATSDEGAESEGSEDESAESEGESQDKEPSGTILSADDGAGGMRVVINPETVEPEDTAVVEKPQNIDLTGATYQWKQSRSIGGGINGDFAKSYSVLTSLAHITKIVESGKNTFLMMSNDTPHEPTLLSEPGYYPEWQVNNTQYDFAHEQRHGIDGSTLTIYGDEQMAHYHVNVATMSELGDWFDYLRACGVYDNTRIILVSDHGWPLMLNQELMLPIYDPSWSDSSKYWDASAFLSLFMMKDFDSQEFAIDKTFMTIADTPSVAFKDLIENPVNPSTGKAITMDDKGGSEVHVTWPMVWDIAENNGNTYLPTRWFSVKTDDIYSGDSWKYLGIY